VNIWINFTSPETRMTVLPDSENCKIIYSFVSTKHWNVTERQTDSTCILRSLLGVVHKGRPQKFGDF